MTMMGNREPFYHPTIVAYKTVFDYLKGYQDLDWTVRTEDLDFYFRFFHAGFKGANMDEILYDARVNCESLKKRTIQNRINYVRTLSHGYALLDIPKYKLIRPIIITAAKALVPMFVVIKYRQLTGRRGKDI